MATTTSFQSYVTAPVNNVLMRGLLSAARRVLPFFNGTVPGELTVSGGSATVKWRRIDNLALVTQALGEVSSAVFGMGRSPTTPTVTNITKAVAKYGGFFYPSEEVDLFNVNSKSAQLLDNLGENAGASLNNLARVEFANSTNARYAGGVASDAVVITHMTTGDIRHAVNNLNRNSGMKHFPMGTGSQNVTSSTIRASYFGVCHPDTEEEVRVMTGFLGVEQYGGYTATLVGEFGAVGGVRWCSSEIASINTSGGTATASSVYRGSSTILNDVYETFIYGREAVGLVGLGDEFNTDVMMGGPETANQAAIELISVSPSQASVANPYGEVGVLSWKAWFAAKILNQNWLWEIRHLNRDNASVA